MRDRQNLMIFTRLAASPDALVRCFFSLFEGPLVYNAYFFDQIQPGAKLGPGWGLGGPGVGKGGGAMPPPHTPDAP